MMHPINEFWEKSGWCNKENPTIDDSLSEGKLAKDAWNTALDDLYQQIYHNCDLRTIEKVTPFFDRMFYNV